MTNQLVLEGKFDVSFLRDFFPNAKISYLDFSVEPESQSDLAKFFKLMNFFYQRETDVVMVTTIEDYEHSDYLRCQSSLKFCEIFEINERKIDSIRAIYRLYEECILYSRFISQLKDVINNVKDVKNNFTLEENLFNFIDDFKADKENYVKGYIDYDLKVH